MWQDLRRQMASGDYLEVATQIDDLERHRGNQVLGARMRHLGNRHSPQLPMYFISIGYLSWRYLEC